MGTYAENICQAMKKPIIIGSKGFCSSCDHVILPGHDKTGVLADGRNSADLAWEICNLFEDIEGAREMGKRGRVRVETYFPRDKIAEHTIALYEEVSKGVGSKGK